MTISILRTSLREQPRHVLFDLQTMKRARIDLEDQSRALAGLPERKEDAYAELSGIRRVSGGVMRQKVSRAESNGDPTSGPEHEKTPSENGVSSLLVTEFQRVSVDLSSGGSGNCIGVPVAASGAPDNHRLDPAVHAVSPHFSSGISRRLAQTNSTGIGAYVPRCPGSVACEPLGEDRWLEPELTQAVVMDALLSLGVLNQPRAHSIDHRGVDLIAEVLMDRARDADGIGQHLQIGDIEDPGWIDRRAAPRATNRRPRPGLR